MEMGVWIPAADQAGIPFSTIPTVSAAPLR
jgi:hypothetical protein